MRELLIATRNKGKFPEMAAWLVDLPFACKSALEVAALEGFEPEETGTTFEANAEIKAREYGTRAGMFTIADDSGVEIDTLGGEPGVMSARYVPGSDVDRYQAVLEKMKEVPVEKRTARFVSVIAVFDPTTGHVVTTRGECPGHILSEPRGERGFGYDPIFFVDALGKTYAEATLEEKMSVDHRGIAMKKMKAVLIEEYV